jgi:hypothetical protein
MKRIIYVYCLLLLVFQTHPLHSYQDNISDNDEKVELINRLIQEKGLRWKAGKTSISQMDKNELEKIICKNEPFVEYNA